MKLLLITFCALVACSHAASEVCRGIGQGNTQLLLDVTKRLGLRLGGSVQAYAAGIEDLCEYVMQKAVLLRTNKEQMAAEAVEEAVQRAVLAAQRMRNAAKDDYPLGSNFEYLLAAANTANMLVQFNASSKLDERVKELLAVLPKIAANHSVRLSKRMNKKLVQLNKALGLPDDLSQSVSRTLNQSRSALELADRLLVPREHVIAQLHKPMYDNILAWDLENPRGAHLDQQIKLVKNQILFFLIRSARPEDLHDAREQLAYLENLRDIMEVGDDDDDELQKRNELDSQVYDDGVVDEPKEMAKMPREGKTNFLPLFRLPYFA